MPDVTVSCFAGIDCNARCYPGFWALPCASLFEDQKAGGHRGVTRRYAGFSPNNALRLNGTLGVVRALGIVPLHVTHGNVPLGSCESNVTQGNVTLSIVKASDVERASDPR